MRKRKEFKRKSGFRDSKLIVIATEGDKTEYQYFTGIKEYYRKPQIHVELIKRKESYQSAPEYVIKSIDDFKKEYKFNDEDEFWIIIDLDKWGVKKLSDISQKCVQKKYSLAVSNPCFEIWLLLHFIKLEDYKNSDFKCVCNNKDTLCKELRRITNNFNSNNIKIDLFIDKIHNAINEAEKLDVNEIDRWPQNIGTRVYLVVKHIMK